MVQDFYTAHPENNRENAIRSRLFDDEPPPVVATPAPAGDSATWESTSVGCRTKAQEDPLIEDEETRAAAGAEIGVASLLAKDSTIDAAAWEPPRGAHIPEPPQTIAHHQPARGSPSRQTTLHLARATLLFSFLPPSRPTRKSRGVAEAPPMRQQSPGIGTTSTLMTRGILGNSYHERLRV